MTRRFIERLTRLTRIDLQVLERKEALEPLPRSSQSMVGHVLRLILRMGHPEIFLHQTRRSLHFRASFGRFP